MRVSEDRPQSPQLPLEADEGRGLSAMVMLSWWTVEEGHFHLCKWERVGFCICFYSIAFCSK